MANKFVQFARRGLCVWTGSWSLRRVVLHWGCLAFALAIVPGTRCQDSGRAPDVEVNLPGSMVFDASDVMYFVTGASGPYLHRFDPKTGLVTPFKTQLFRADDIAVMRMEKSGQLIASVPVECRVVEISVNDGSVRTIVGMQKNGITKAGCGSDGDKGPALKASLEPSAFAVEENGNLLILDQSRVRRIRLVDQATGIITSLVGSSRMNLPTSLAVDKKGNLYIAQVGHGTDNRPIMRLSSGSGRLTPLKKADFIGDTRLWEPTNRRFLDVDGNGNLYVSTESKVFYLDMGKRSVSLVAGTTKGFSGDGGPAVKAQMYWPSGFAVDSAGNIYIGDTENQRIRRVDAKTHIITTVVGNGLPQHIPGTMEMGPY